LAEDKAYVSSEEIVEAIKLWPNYQSKQVSAEDVRAWLGQRPSHIEQRYLFTILQNLRFFTDNEIREKLGDIHSSIKRQIPDFVQRRRSHTRKDIIVTYVDGPGKSGASYASLYAEENGINAQNVMEIEGLKGFLSSQKESNAIASIIIVDDIIGTGNTMKGNLKAFFSNHLDRLAELGVRLDIAVIAATQKGDVAVRRYLEEVEFENVDLRICEVIDENHIAFNGQDGIWSSDSEKNIAKELIQDIGYSIQKNNPLGYGDGGLMVVFSRNCPNNSLPLLHSSGKKESPWRPLFPRIMH